MSTAVHSAPRRLFAGGLSSGLVVALGILAIALPTFFSLARQHWSTDDGVHGPIILATGAWLLWRERATILAEARPGPAWALALLIPVLLVYAFGRAYNILFLETGSLYVALVLLAWIYWGAAVLRKIWFPILYLGFLVNLPGSLVTDLTQPLKLWISGIAVELLYWAGYPVAGSGAEIYVAQYQLLVEDACAGLNSLFSLVAIGLLYVYLNRREGALYVAVMAFAAIPTAILANLVRVLIIILLTYHVSDSVAQGFAHDFAGLTMFVVSLLALFGLDALMSRLVRLGRRKARA
jgi:exosortase